MIDSLSYARSALEMKRAKKKILANQKTIRLKDRRIGQLSSENSQNQEIADPKNNQISQSILDESLENSQKAPSGVRYSNQTYSFALNLMFQSQSSYDFVRNEFPLPSKQSVRKHFREEISATTQCLTNLNLMNNIIHDYRNSFNLNSIMTLPSILSVDAICFKPIISVTKDGKISGIENFTMDDTNDTFNPEKMFTHYNDDPSLFEEFLRKQWNQAYSAAFVYQLQPLNSGFPSLVLHVQPASDGKAKDVQCNTLNFIRDRVLSNHIVIKGYAFDGDSAYRAMHLKYFNQWAHNVVNNTNIFDYSVHDRLRIISDPLHLLKRARYRLLKTLEGCSIIAGFNASSPSLDISAMEQTLNLPSVVFLNLPITKMHDSLPMKLFSLCSLKKLFIAKQLPSLSYFLPWSLFLNAFTVQDISDNLRYDLFEITTFYLLFYLESFKSNTNDGSIGQKKSQNCPHLVLFDENLVIETANSLHANLMLMSTIDGEVNQGHVASTPLEHTFGKTRMKCKYKQTLDRIIASITVEEMNTITKIFNDSKIKGRVNKSITTNFSPEQYIQSFRNDNRSIALSLCNLFQQKSSIFSEEEAFSIMNSFFFELFQNQSMLHVYVQKNVLSSTRHNLSVSGGPCNRRKMLSIKNEEKSLINPSMEAGMKTRLKTIFGKNVTRPILKQLLIELQVVYQVKVPREVNRKLSYTLKWLDENWDALNPFILDIARVSQII